MTITALQELATEYMKIWSSGNQDLLDKYAHNDLKVDYSHFEKPYEGVSDYKAMLSMTYKYFPDISIALNKVVPNENDNSITVKWQYSGKHQQGELFGVEASGKQVTVKGMTLLEVENGLVKKESGIVDNLSLIMQLAVLR